MSKEKCLKKYERLVSQNILVWDPEQVKILQELEILFKQMMDFLSNDTKRRFTRILFSTKKKSRVLNSSGLYLYGGVGTGKSIISNLFFESFPLQGKLRVHFHEFMQQIHIKINEARKNGCSDPVLEVAKNLVKEVDLLYLDELQISDITDAMIVGRLFSKLFDLGVQIIITSNRNPADLYKDGLNRKLFEPFIQLICNELRILEIGVTIDYRRHKLLGSPVYLQPNNEDQKCIFNKLWIALVPEATEVLSLSNKGRNLNIPLYCNGVGRVTFLDLCGKPLGASDYLLICMHLRVLFLEGIPILSEIRADAAKRFITLIDTLYESKVKLVSLADALPEDLYKKGPSVFEFDRTISRLYEMQSEDWTR